MYVNILIKGGGKKNPLHVIHQKSELSFIFPSWIYEQKMKPGVLHNKSRSIGQKNDNFFVLQDISYNLLVKFYSIWLCSEILFYLDSWISSVIFIFKFRIYVVLVTESAKLYFMIVNYTMQ